MSHATIATAAAIAALALAVAVAPGASAAETPHKLTKSDITKIARHDPNVVHEEAEHGSLVPSPTLKNGRWEVGFFRAGDELALVIVDPDSGAILESVFQDIEEAVRSGSLEEVEDPHISRTPMVVDKQGWSDVASLLAGTLDRLLEIQAESSERLANGDEDGILSKVELLHFKSPDPKDGAGARVEARSAASE